MLNAWFRRQNILDFKWFCIMWTIKILNFSFFEKYQKDVENLVESHWKRDLYCNSFGLFNVAQVLSYNLGC